MQRHSGTVHQDMPGGVGRPDCRPKHSEEPIAGDPAIWGSTTARGSPWPSVTSALISRVIGCGSLH